MPDKSEKVIETAGVKSSDAEIIPSTAKSNSNLPKLVDQVKLLSDIVKLLPFDPSTEKGFAKLQKLNKNLVKSKALPAQDATRLLKNTSREVFLKLKIINEPDLRVYNITPSTRKSYQDLIINSVNKSLEKITSPARSSVEGVKQISTPDKEVPKVNIIPEKDTTATKNVNEVQKQTEQKIKQSQPATELPTMVGMTRVNEKKTEFQQNRTPTDTPSETMVEKTERNLKRVYKKFNLKFGARENTPPSNEARQETRQTKKTLTPPGNAKDISTSSYVPYPSNTNTKAFKEAKDVGIDLSKFMHHKGSSMFVSPGTSPGVSKGKSGMKK